MFINQAIIKELYRTAGDARIFRAKQYVKDKRVSL